MGNSASVRATTSLTNRVGEAGRLMETGCAAARIADAVNGESGEDAAVAIGSPCRSYIATNVRDCSGSWVDQVG